MNTIYKGEDIKIEFTLTDLQYQPIDISQLNDIIVYIYNIISGTPTTIFKYSLSSRREYKSIIRGYDDTNGRFKILIESTESVDLQDGDIYAEIKVIFPDSDFPDGDLKTVTADIMIGNVRESLTKNE